MLNHDTATRRFRCRHIFTGGRRCGSPSLRNEDFCYYHHTTRRPAPNSAHDAYNNPPNETVLTLPVPEDTTAIQLSVGEIMNALARNAIDPRRAGLLLYALQIASQNLRTHGPKAGAGQRPGPVVEEITLDPALGPLAPLTEIDEDDEDDEDEAKAARRGSPTLRRLVAKLSELDHPEPQPVPQPVLQPAPQLVIQAVAAQPTAPRQTCRRGYRSGPNSPYREDFSQKYGGWGTSPKNKGRLRGDDPHNPAEATLTQASAPQPPAKPGHPH